ncbi:EcsC family protein [Zobellia galactanivorans]|uniref:EcsC family protein n=1 Tax=Zobellia galactanivorans (strain DSM 12802 / CCUG 47099 / CIP 106680 / NCIMB 13871 / Dsij) TaxID=63186 RepID=UPI00209155B8|nr:EcsC family protein [Zobellia galactanivorans]
MKIENKKLAPDDLLTLHKAKQKMEQIGWAMQGLNKMGNLIESRIQLLPQKQRDRIQQITYKVLHTVVKSNLISMDKNAKTTPSNKFYKALVTSSGAIGGALGVTAFAVDLTLATKLMMRSIMDIARSEGEDLNSLDSQLACLQVFALGGKSKHDDHLDTGYYATRIAISSTVKGASGIAGKTLTSLLNTTGNPLLQLIAQVASRFSVQVSEKFVAQAIPIVGAAGGATINLAFIDHFQNMAHAHFSIRRLERKYGEDQIRLAYEELSITKI